MREYGPRCLPPRCQCWRTQNVSPKHPRARTERLSCPERGCSGHLCCLQARIPGKILCCIGSQVAVRGGNCAVRRRRFVATGDGESVWKAALSPECCPVREYPIENRGCPGVASGHVSIRRGVVSAGDRVQRAVRVRSVPSSHEDNQLPWPDRQTVRRAGHDSELEHNNCYHADFEESTGRTREFQSLKSGSKIVLMHRLRSQ
jgi:hypothetical protein